VPEIGLAVIAVGAGIGEQVDAAVAKLDGKGVGMGMSGDREKAMGAVIAAAPQLVGTGLDIAEQDKTGIDEQAGTAGSAPDRLQVCRGLPSGKSGEKTAADIRGNASLSFRTTQPCPRLSRRIRSGRSSIAIALS